MVVWFDLLRFGWFAGWSCCISLANGFAWFVDGCLLCRCFVGLVMCAACANLLLVWCVLCGVC